MLTEQQERDRKAAMHAAGARYLMKLLTDALADGGPNLDEHVKTLLLLIRQNLAALERLRTQDLDDEPEPG